MSFDALAAAALLLSGGLFLALSDVPARCRAARLTVVLVLAGLTAAYLAWRWGYTLPPLTPHAAAVWAWAFFGLEGVAIAFDLWSLFVLVRITDHTPAATAAERRLRRHPAPPAVDVFIPTYNEAREVLEPAILAALGLDYPAGRLTVWVLDDGRRAWLRVLCARLGARYLTRPDSRGYKAGNLNNALRHARGEVVAVADADFVLLPNFLYRTVGLLVERPDVGLVQTPQHFRNPDPVQHNLGGGRAWTEEQNFFMTVGQAGRDAHGNAFCVGSSFVVRRACLDLLGGFPARTVSEDLELSYALLARGFLTLYLNERLSHGLAPESVAEFIKQRVRWCTGTLQQAFLRTGPFRARGLSPLDRLFYADPILFWLTTPFLVALLLAPVVYWWTGVAPMTAPTDGAGLMALARYAGQSLLMYWLSDRKVMPVVSTVARGLAAFHLVAALVRTLVRPFGTPFAVTDKGLDRSRVVVRWSIAWPFVLSAVLLVAGMAASLAGCPGVVRLTGTAVWDVAWSLYSLLILTLCALACVERPVVGRPPQPEDEVLHGDALAAAGAVTGRILG